MGFTCPFPLYSFCPKPRTWLCADGFRKCQSQYVLGLQTHFFSREKNCFRMSEFSEKFPELGDTLGCELTFFPPLLISRPWEISVCVYCVYCEEIDQTRTCPFQQIDPTTGRTDSENANAGVKSFTSTTVLWPGYSSGGKSAHLLFYNITLGGSILEL